MSDTSQDREADVSEVAENGEMESPERSPARKVTGGAGGKSSHHSPTSPTVRIYTQYGARGGRFSTSRPKSDVEWKILRAREVPGPGAYGTKEFSQSGGKISNCKPKSDVDWIMIRAAQIPAPGDYDVINSVKYNGGKFSTAKPKTDLDWTMLRASRTPGPGSYDPDRAYVVGGGRFSAANPKSDVDWVIHRAKRTPGPGQYDIDKVTRGQGGGRFSTANPKSDVEWKIYRAKQQPGPGYYNIGLNHRVPGGKISVSNTKSDVDVAIHIAKDLPGPGEYNYDFTSISCRVANAPHQASTPTAPYTKPKVFLEIPPEARGTPKPKPPPREHSSQRHSRSVSRASSSGFVIDRSKIMEEEKPRVRSASPTRWYVSAEAAAAYGVSAADYKKKEKKRSYGTEQHSKRKVKSPTSGEKLRPLTVGGEVDQTRSQASTAPGTAARAERGRRQTRDRGVLNINGDLEEDEDLGPPLSEDAQRLFDLAMESNEFKRIMQLYTGLEDPEEVIVKYATLWSNDALRNQNSYESSDRPRQQQ